MTTNRQVTSSEAASMLGVSQRTVIRWADEGKLPVANRVPGRNGARLFNDNDVEALAGQLRDELRKHLAAIGGAA
jgi:excisionase family DNA binding protein